MKLVKVLILGGTKFLGLEYFKLLKNDNRIDVHIASRGYLDANNFHNIDRKNQLDLEKILRGTAFDVIVDFINFSMPDSRKLINAINSTNNIPYLITISSTYVYGHPLKLVQDKKYIEIDFDPAAYPYSQDDRPVIDYYEGKRSMEAYLFKNYSNFVSVRFPIILGGNDYTGRTNFFSEVIKNGRLIHFDKTYGRSNFIFSIEAAKILYFLTLNRMLGTLNGCLSDQLDQLEILDLYCKFYKVSISNIINEDGEGLRSPFYYKRDFLIDNSRMNSQFSLNTNFECALYRELKKITEA